MMCRKPFVKLANGKVKRLQVPLDSSVYEAMTPFPCGSCFDCRLAMQKKWVSRLFLESKNHDEMCWLTLTYDEENCPHDLDKREAQRFIKRLRKHFPPKSIRYFLVGEYGDKNFRPHYHAIIFGVAMDKKEVIKSCWKHGFIQVGYVSPASIKYTVKYALKHLTSEDDPLLKGRKPEFKLSSIGIGLDTLESYAENLTPYKEFLDVVDSLHDGKRKIYLDSFAKKKLHQIMGMEENLERRKESYIREMFAKHYDPTGKTFYIDNIVNEKADERRTRETNITKTFRKGRKL